MQLYFEIISDISYEIRNTRKTGTVLGFAPDFQLVTDWLVY